MFKSYFKIAWRYLFRNKIYTTINISGLAIGVACALLIMVFVRSELSYDRFNSKADRIYRLWQYEKSDGQEFKNTVTSVPAGPAIQRTYPEVEAMCRVNVFNTLVKKNNQSFNENITMVDSTLFRIFDFKLLSGNRNQPFPNNSTVIITTKIAKKYFGNTGGDYQHVIGKTFEMTLGDKSRIFTVAGIAADPPEESSVRFDFLIPYSNDKYVFNERMLNSWFNVFGETYLLLRKNVTAASLEKKFPAMLRQQLGSDYGTEEYNLYLQPLTSIHLDNTLPAGIRPVSNPKYVYILSTIGLVILLIACFNFITLSVGRSTSRALEVGIRKTLGAQRKQLIKQFWGEALFLTVLSVIIGFILAVIFLKPFSTIVGHPLSFHFDIPFIAFCLLLICFIAMVAGIYPAIILSGFNPVAVLKGKLNLKSAAGILRKGLIISQFAASIILIFCTITISRQMNYLHHKNLGYNKDQVIIIPTNKRRAEGFPLARLYINELKKYPQVASAGVSMFSFGETPWATLGYSDEKRQYHDFQFNQVGTNFLNTMDVPLVQGRSFSPDNTADSNNSIIVNETLVKTYGIQDPVGKKFGNYSQKIVGVVKDFNYESLHSKIKPLVLALKFDTLARQSNNVMFANSPQPRVSVRMKQGNLQDNIQVLKKVWQAVFPNQEFEYYFLDDKLAMAYGQEQKSALVVKISSALSIFIACLGLLGLATLTVTRRTKEIGIRKVLGANPGQLVSLISKEFIGVVAVAAVIAFPVGWWAMEQWLADFAYRTQIEWWIFMLAGVISLAIAIITISTQAIKAAVANPVESLRTE